MKRKSHKRTPYKYRKTIRKGGNNLIFSVTYPSKKLNSNMIYNLSKNNTKSIPIINFLPTPGKLYTILMWDPDAPAKPSWIHWIVTNIETPGQIPQNTKLSYQGPNPPSGVHRYFFGLFEQQSGKINPMISGVRGNFNYTEFIQENNLKPTSQIIMRVSSNST
jgi:phosphatidylethanolamine-binding protein (PEBP) family uncharacterized protein